MTVDDTLNATLFAIEQMELDLLAQLQSGHLTGQAAINLLRAFDVVRMEFMDLKAAADHSPELCTRYAAPGGSANRPSVN